MKWPDKYNIIFLLRIDSHHSVTVGTECDRAKTTVDMPAYNDATADRTTEKHSMAQGYIGAKALRCKQLGSGLARGHVVACSGWCFPHIPQWLHEYTWNPSHAREGSSCMDTYLTEKILLSQNSSTADSTSVFIHRPPKAHFIRRFGIDFLSRHPCMQ